jgi:serine/threonine protein kinase
LDHVLFFFEIPFLFSIFIIDSSFKILGKGGEGIVYAVKHANTRNEYAMKEIFVRKPENAVKVKNEIETIRKLPPSPYIVKYYNPMESTQNVYILMEYCRGGSLQEFIEKRASDNLPLKERVFFFFFFCKNILGYCSHFQQYSSLHQLSAYCSNYTPGY